MITCKLWETLWAQVKIYRLRWYMYICRCITATVIKNIWTWTCTINMKWNKNKYYFIFSQTLLIFFLIRHNRMELILWCWTWTYCTAMMTWQCHSAPPVHGFKHGFNFKRQHTGQHQYTGNALRTTASCNQWHVLPVRINWCEYAPNPYRLVRFGLDDGYMKLNFDRASLTAATVLVTARSHDEIRCGSCP